jgi:hypothetical protein
MLARIYKPAKTAMQQGEARTKEWVIQFAPASPREIDPLMGWTSSADMRAQVTLEFDTKEEAIGFAEREGLPYKVFEPEPRRMIRKSYADNFKFDRIGRWTH